MSALLFKNPPGGWAIINHNHSIKPEERRLRLRVDDKTAKEQIQRAKSLPNMEIRYYFKDFVLALGEDHLNPQFEAVYTELPGGLVQDFHSHQGTCLEITLVTSGRLLAIEHPNMEVGEVYDMTRSEFFFGIGDIIEPGDMHIVDPYRRHTLTSLTNATFWTWKLPRPQADQEAFASRRFSL